MQFGVAAITNSSFTNMKKELNNEELQSRREFFKRAAKAALPVVGAVVLANLPILRSEAAPSDCNYNCVNGCYGCKNTCKGGCQAECLITCAATCATQAAFSK